MNEKQSSRIDKNKIKTVHLLIDTRLVLFLLHHRKQSLLDVTNIIANLYFSRCDFKVLPTVHFLFDAGASRRTQYYREYKAHRKEKRKTWSEAELEKYNQFNEQYNKMYSYLSNFGRVYKLNGVEADDLASILGQGLLTDKNETETLIVYYSADSDWIKFLFNSTNYSILNPVKKIHIFPHDVKDFYGFTPEQKLTHDCLVGVAKENVLGISRLGTKRFLSLYDKVDGDLDELFEILDEYTIQGKFGMSLPEGFSSVRELYEFNYELFRPWSYKDLYGHEKEALKNQLSMKPSRDSQKIFDDAIELFQTIKTVTQAEKKFFKLQE